MQITDQLIQIVAEFKQELYNRLDRIRQLEQTRKEVINYFGRARIMDGVFARFSPGREELKNLSDNDLTIQKVDNGYRIEWMIIDGDSYDTIFMTLPALFIKDFDGYYNKIKDEIEANNELEKVKFVEYQAKQKLEALEAKQKEIEKMEAKLQADKAKIDKLRKNLSNSGIEL